MPSEVDICNRALWYIGANRIGSLNEVSDEAQACNALLPAVIDETIRSYNWNCATARTTLSQLSDAPTWGYTYQYALPTDCLRVLHMDDLKNEFKVEGNNLLTDEGTVNILYLRRISVNDMDALLASATAIRLGHDLAYALSRDKGTLDRMEKLWRTRQMEAAQMDAQEGTPDTLEVDTWLYSRM